MAATSGLVVLMLLALQQCCVYAQNSTDDRLELMNDLLDNYAERARYVLPSSPVNVKLGLTLISITNLNHAQKIATMSVWLKMTWVDPRLRWNPADHGGIKSIRIPMQSIWRPDITLYRKIDHELLLDESILAVVSHDGTMLWIPPSTISVVCPGGSANTWECAMDFGSWVYDGHNLDLSMYEDTEHIDLFAYYGDDNIEITKNKAEKEVKMYDCCTEPYPRIHYTLNFETKGALSGSFGQIYRTFTYSQLTVFLITAMGVLFHF